jgi:hypothetical protein
MVSYRFSALALLALRAIGAVAAKAVSQLLSPAPSFAIWPFLTLTLHKRG